MYELSTPDAGLSMPLERCGGVSTWTFQPWSADVSGAILQALECARSRQVANLISGKFHFTKVSRKPPCNREIEGIYFPGFLESDTRTERRKIEEINIEAIITSKMIGMLASVLKYVRGGMMKTSIEARLAIMYHEGVVLAAYQDIADVWTIGVGHTASRGDPIPKQGMAVTLEQAIAVMNKDIEACETEVLAAVKKPLSQQQFDAIVTWQFNLGRIGRSDTTLTKRLNEERYSEAAEELLRWDKATVKGVKRSVGGLTRRRVAEREMFLNGDYGSGAIPVSSRPKVIEKVYSRAEMRAVLEGGALRMPPPVQPTQPQPLPPPGGTSMPPIADDSDRELSDAELAANPATLLLPRYRPRQRDSVTRATLAKFSYLLPANRRNDSVQILAVRGYYESSLGVAGQNDRGLYDDAIFVVEPNAVHCFNANTDPSKFRPGIAQLKAPQAVRYRPGLHGISRGPGYPAFRQDAPITVIRDNRGEDRDRDGSFFAINLHRGGINTTSSEGCQTVPPHQWTEFKALVDGLLARYNQRDFYYVIVNNAEVAVVSPVESQMPDPAKLPPGPSLDRNAETLLLLQRLLELNSQKTSSQQDAGANDLKGLALILKQLEAASNKQSGAATGAELTPVNAAMGASIGNALDGKKTAMGTIGLLATSLLPELAKIVPSLLPVVPVITAAAPTLITVFGALTGWGVLGKIDKWFATRT